MSTYPIFKYMTGGWGGGGWSKKFNFHNTYYSRLCQLAFAFRAIELCAMTVLQYGNGKVYLFRLIKNKKTR